MRIALEQTNEQMQDIKILIVEDDLNYALELEMLVEKLGYKVLATVDSADQVFGILENDIPDLILMDIQLNGKLNGIEITKQIEDQGISVIFITNFDKRETFNQAKSTKHFGYLIKPFNHLTLESAIEVALMNKGENDDFIKTDWEEDLVLKDFVFIKKRNRLEKVAIDDIKYLEVEGNYIFVITHTEKFVLKASMKKVIENFDKKQFIRVSKQYVVNLKKVSRIILSENKIFVDDEYFILGRKYKPILIKRLQLLK